MNPCDHDPEEEIQQDIIAPLQTSPLTQGPWLIY